MIFPSFSYYQEYFILYVVRQCDAAQLQAAYPARYIFGLHGVEDIAEFFFLFGSVPVGSGSDVLVKFLVVIIFYFLADSGEQALFLSYFVLAATFNVYFLHFGHGVQFAIINLLLKFAVAYYSRYGGYYGKGNQANNQYPHMFSFLEKSVLIK